MKVGLLSPVDTGNKVEFNTVDFVLNRQQIGNKVERSTKLLPLPRDAMQARSMLSCSVCPSVRPSRSWITSKQINIFSKFFHHRVATSGISLVFQYQRGCRYSDGNPPNGGVECKGV